MEFKHPIDRVQLRAYIQQFEENGGDLNDLCKPDQYPDLNNLLGSDGIARLQTFEKRLSKICTVIGIVISRIQTGYLWKERLLIISLCFLIVIMEIGFTYRS